MTANEASERVALVTGAGRRVGRAIARGLAKDGYAVAVHYNGSSSGAEQTRDEILANGGRAIVLQHDLTAPESAGTLVEKTRAELGAVVVLINSASLFDEDQLGDLTLESWRSLIDVNLSAPVFLMQAFSNQDPVPASAAIVNILDTQMTSASPERFSYFCGKFGLEGATRLAAFDLASKGITVNAVAPGLVLPSGQSQQEFDDRQKLTPLGQGLGADDIVNGVRYLISARQVTGHTLVVDAGQKLMGMGNTPISKGL
ncbi:MAG: SDR family oxidoreductase [Hyphomicrobiaceae bacterium TMED74]|nr:short-chain dehydrogenase [Filomicrobium sp.]RPG36375.1 MAG: SDR family oxidoreductase [Hyphomicrobiaceae bacterium TMED74]